MWNERSFGNLAITNSTNFIKTSTSKIIKGANFKAAVFMCFAIAKTYIDSKKLLVLRYLMVSEVVNKLLSN